MLTKEEFMSKLQEARRLEVKKKELVGDIFEDYTFENIPFEAEDADNFGDAIECYIQYGEFPMSGKLEEFWEVYSREVSSLEED